MDIGEAPHARGPCINIADFNPGVIQQIGLGFDTKQEVRASSATEDRVAGAVDLDRLAADLGQDNSQIHRTGRSQRPVTDNIVEIIRSLNQSSIDYVSGGSGDIGAISAKRPDAAEGER